MRKKNLVARLRAARKIVTRLERELRSLQKEESARKNREKNNEACKGLLEELGAADGEENAGEDDLMGGETNAEEAAEE